MEKISFYTLGLLFLLISCSQENQKIAKTDFNIESIKPLIIEKSRWWNKGIKNKDRSIFLDLYDKNGHYLPDAENAIHGNQAIADYWQNSWDFVKELHLHMESLEGTENLLYETGNGTIMIMNNAGNFDKFNYKYVNAWKKQPDDTYRVVIDIFNDVKQ